MTHAISGIKCKIANDVEANKHSIGALQKEAREKKPKMVRTQSNPPFRSELGDHNYWSELN